MIHSGRIKLEAIRRERNDKTERKNYIREDGLNKYIERYKLRKSRKNGYSHNLKRRNALDEKIKIKIFNRNKRFWKRKRKIRK